MFEVGIHYKTEAIRKLYETAGVQTNKSSGFDLMNVEDVELNPMNRFQLIDLGVVIKLPEGMHSLLMPRSSTFKNWQIIQTNSIGLIDEDYCGVSDIWKMPTYYLGNDVRLLRAGTRIAQFLIEPRNFFTIKTFNPEVLSRGGFGSTGK